MIKLIIFDLSNVCFSLEEPPFLKKFAERYNLPYAEFEEMYLELLYKAEIDQGTGEGLWKKLFKKYHLELDADKVIEEMMEMKIAHQEILDLAQELRKKYKTAYLTNYNKDYWDCIVNKFEFKKYFDFGIVSYQVKARKPDAKGFQAILEHFSLHPEEAVFIDDSESNLVEPGRLGIKTILFENKEQLIEELKKLK